MKKILDIVNESYMSVKDLSQGSIIYYMAINKDTYYKDIFALPDVNGRFKVASIKSTAASVNLELIPISKSGKAVKLSIPHEDWDSHSKDDIMKWSDDKFDYEISCI